MSRFPIMYVKGFHIFMPILNYLVLAIAWPGQVHIGKALAQYPHVCLDVGSIDTQKSFGKGLILDQWRLTSAMQ